LNLRVLPPQSRVKMSNSSPNGIIIERERKERGERIKISKADRAHLINEKQKMGEKQAIRTKVLIMS